MAIDYLFIPLTLFNPFNPFNFILINSLINN
jgi:hypothetical protein